MRKKIGVITMHRVTNYGSFLQAYATQYIIEQLGYSCELIDYKYPNKWQIDRSEKHRGAVKRFVHTLICPFGLLPEHRKQNKIKSSIREHYKLSKMFYKSYTSINKNPPEYDIYVTGSDQTLNTRFTKGDMTFLLAFAPQNAKKIAFSSSLASEVIKEEFIEEYKYYLNQYQNISIRENNGVKALNKLIDNNIDVTLDPTLVLNKEDWKKLSEKKENTFKDKKYILLYMLSYAYDPRPYIYNLLKDLQEKTNLEVITFSRIPSQYNINHTLVDDAGIEEYLHLFESAKYVVTSSFHGTAFAVNFGIPLFSIVKEVNGNDARQSSFLTNVGLENCIVPIDKKLDKINPNYNIKNAHIMLDKLRLHSKQYLSKALG